jgi:hypothetical protein
MPKQNDRDDYELRDEYDFSKLDFVHLQANNRLRNQVFDLSRAD